MKPSSLPFIIVSVSIGAIATLIVGETKKQIPKHELFGISHSATPPKFAATTNFKPANFQDQAYLRGIHAYHQQQSKGLTGLDESLGSGVCALDINNDNAMDVFAVGGSGHTRFYGRKSWWAQKQQHRLYHNNGAGHFTDISERINIDGADWGMGCASADLNNDGWTDIVLTSRHSVSLLINQQGETFTTQQIWHNSNSWPTSIAIDDADNDGWLDIYIANYLVYDKSAKHFEGNSGYNLSQAVKFDPSFYSGAGNLLLMNKGIDAGQLQFDERAQAMNAALAESRTLSAHWLDANGDQYPDLLAVNDTGSASQLLINQNGERFQKAEGTHQLDIPSHTRSASIDDIDNDGDADIVLSTATGDTPVILQKESGQFNNVAWRQFEQPETTLHQSGYGVTLADLNNDGVLDVYSANGQVQPDPDSHYQPQGQHNSISLRQSNGRLLEQVINTGGSLSSRSAIKIDADNDGDSDLLVSNNNGPLQLLINQSDSANWIGIVSDENLIKATLTTSQRQLTRFNSRQAFLGSHDPRLIFSLKTVEHAKKLDLYHRDGSVKTIKDPEHNHYLMQGDTPPDNEPNTAYSPRDFHWIKWTIIAGKAERRDLAAFNTLSPESKIAWIELIEKYKTEEHLPLLQQVLMDSNALIVHRSIQALTALEREDTAHWIYDLFQSDVNFDRCVLADAYRHFFIEEEALVHRKNIAITPLTGQLNSSSKEVVDCTLLALSESKSVRASQAIAKLINSGNHENSLETAIYALGELRRTQNLRAVSVNANKNTQSRTAYDFAQQKANHTRLITELPQQQLSLQPAQKEISIKNSHCTLNNDFDSTQNINQAVILLNQCNNIEIKQWAIKNKYWLDTHYAILLNSKDLTLAALIPTLLAIHDSNPRGLNHFVSTQITNSKNLDRRLLFTRSIPANKSAEYSNTLKPIYLSKKSDIALRIAVGDKLINSHSDFVLKGASEIFNE